LCSFFDRIDALNGGQLSRGDSTSVWLRRREARIDLKPVTESYLDVEREMGGYPERQARADDRRERY
jgi:hypothetical protein